MKMPAIAMQLPPKERAFIWTVVRKGNRVRKQLQKIAPEVDRITLNLVAADLAVLWEIGERHRRRIAVLLKMNGTSKDRKAVAESLRELLYRDVLAELPLQSKSLKKNLPTVIEALSRKK
jgi:hypothetical protein